MSIDKKIDYVNQDGFKNYIKNSKSVTVPKEFKSRKNATPTKLAYITADEAKMLKKMKKGTPHKGPKGIPSYDDFDAQGNFRSGAAMSAAETGGKTERDRADLRQARISPQEARNLRSSAIAAGAGQRVNPSFFDSRNVISPAELKAAKEFAKTSPFAKTAMRKTRRSGFGLLGLLGNLVRGIGQSFGLGKKFNQPTYDMSRLSGLPLGGSAAFENLDIRDKFNRLGDEEEGSGILIDPTTLLPQRSVVTENKIRPDVNLLAQPVYNLDGSLRENDAFGYFDLPDGYFDTDTNIKTNKNTNTSGGIVPLLNSDDLGEELEQVVGKLNLSS
tara:strand:+ start:10 stop:999 length:990 start_codon:yes stop_codon:yes gene_type:complete